MEHGEDDNALELFERTLRGLPPLSPEEPRWHLWLGYAYQKRGRCSLALQHLEAAASVKWLLNEYASLGLAQCHLALGHVDAAQRVIDSMASDAPLADDVQLFKAELASQLGQVSLAIDIWRAYLKVHANSSTERTMVRLDLADALAAPRTTNSVEAGSASPERPSDESLKEALALVEGIGLKDLDRSNYERVCSLRAAIIAKLFETDESQRQQCAIRNQADEVDSLIEKREFRRAQTIAAEVIPEFEKTGVHFSAEECRIQFAMAQAHLALGDRVKGTAELKAVYESCAEPEDVVARALYMMAHRLQDQHELSQAILGFETLERRFPKHPLVDDARLRVAYAYLELGSESKFTECIQHMAEDFPDSELAAEGLFQLALKSMTRSDWATAATVLSQMGRLPRITNRKDVDQAERQIYFLARSQFQLGQKESAFAGLERLVRERPFSYYMLSAYSRLLELDRARVMQVSEAACTGNGASPFSVPYQPQFEKPAFGRAMELMALGECQRGVKELKSLQLPQEIEPLFLWARATFEARAGSFKNSQRLVRERLQAWPRQWPAEAWEPAWKIAYPRPFLDLVVAESKRSRVPEALIYAIMREESQFDRDAVSPADAYGLMQLIIPTAKSAAKSLGMTATASSLKRPSLNVALGSAVLESLMKQFDALPLLAIPAYNAGPGRPRRWLKERPNLDFDVWIETIPFTETRTYFKHVLASWATYAWLYDREHSESAMKLPLRMAN